MGTTRVGRTLGREARLTYGERVRFMHYDLPPTLRRTAARMGGAAPAPAFAAGETVLLLGDTATTRGELALAAARCQVGFRLIAMCYDLIPWTTRS